VINDDIPVDSEPVRELSEREIIAILDSYQEAAISTRNSHLSKERGKALEYYNMEPYGDEKKTGSSVVTSEVFDTDRNHSHPSRQSLHLYRQGRRVRA
jgi:hypothetical protein